MKKSYTFILFCLLLASFEVFGSKNAQLVGITSPKLGTRDAFFNEKIVVTLKNVGTEAIESVDLYYKVDNQVPIKEVHRFSRALAKDSTYVYTFQNLADLSSFPNVAYKLRAWLHVEGDDVPTNDSTYAITLTNIMANVPYTLPNAMDEWKTLNANGGKTWTRPDWLTNKKIPFWQYDGSAQNLVANDYLFSRPVFLRKDKMYQFDFSAYTVNATDVNKLEVFLAYRFDTLSRVTSLFSSDAVDHTSCKNKQIRFTPTVDSSYYLVFKVYSDPKKAALHIEKIHIREVHEKDAVVVNLIAPTKKKMQYTEQEQVKIEIQNAGSTPMSREKVSLSVSVGEKTLRADNVSLDLAPNTSMIYTFTETLNLKGLNAVNGIFELSASVSMEGDVDKNNDTLKQTMTELLIQVPYFPNFGTSSAPTYEEDYWIVEDKNKDGKAWAAIEDISKRVLAYGENTSTSKDVLYSRPLSLEADHSYKVQFYAKVNSTTKGEMPLNVALYRQAGDSMERVSSLITKDMGNTAYERYVCEVNISTKDIYYIGFAIEADYALDFDLMLDRFSVEEALEYDFLMQELLSSGNKISNLDSLPFGISVFNNGKRKIEQIDMYYQINSETPIKESITLNLEAYKEKVVYLSQKVSFKGITPTSFKMWSSWENDLNKGNDSVKIAMGTLTSAVPFYRMDGNAEGWVILDQNQDGTRWKKEGSVMRYTANNSVANDYLISRHITLQADTLYCLSLSVKHIEDGEKCNLRVMMGESNYPETYTTLLADYAQFERTRNPNGPPGFLYYIRVPKDGDYVFSFQAYGETKSIEIGSISINKNAPQNVLIDLAVTEITAPVKDTVYGAKEKVSVKIKNQGKVTANGATLYCKVGENIYSGFLDPNPTFTTGKEIEYTFSNVDLSEVKTHEIIVFTSFSQDSVPSNDTLKKSIKSLPIHDVNLQKIENPVSGALGTMEQISLWVKNEGKGAIDFIPLEVMIDAVVVALDTIKETINQGDSILFTVSKRFDFSVEKTYKIQIQSQLVDDVNRQQDTVVKSVVSTKILPDAGVLSIIEPSDKVMTAKEIVKICVKNFSAADAYDVVVECVSGEQLIRGTIPEIKAFDSIVYQFTSTLDLRVVGNHTLVAYTCIAKDADKTNDTCSKTLRSQKIDIALTSILSPKSGLNLGDEVVRIRIKNEGETTLKNIPVHYQVGAENIVKETITDSIRPQDSLEYAFNRLVDLSNEGTSVLQVWTALLGDMNVTNDTLTTSVLTQKAEVDAGVVAITSPVSGELTSATNITIVVKNFCDVELKDIPVECNIGTLNLQGVITQSIAPKDSCTYTFSQTIDMSKEKSYEVVAYTVLANDKEPENDLFVITVNAVSLESGSINFAKIYPNPASDVLHISSAALLKTIRVYNAIGQEVVNHDFLQVSSFTLSLAGFKTGVYYIDVKTSTGESQKSKIIVNLQ